MNRFIHFFLASLWAFCLCPIHAQQKISPTIVNLETIYRGEPMSFDFCVRNQAEFPLVIKSVTVSTGALKINYPENPISPGGTGIIHVTLYTQDLTPGQYKKLISVKTNGKPSSYRLTVKGVVSDEIPSRQTRNDGIVWIKTYSDGKYGAEFNSKVIMAPVYDNLQYSKALEAFIGMNGNKLDLLTSMGMVLCSTEFQEYFIDRGGLLVKNNSYMSYIDMQGKTVIPFSEGYNSLTHVLGDEIGEYFFFDKSNTIGVLDGHGKVTFEMPNLPNGNRVVNPYYIDGRLLYVSNDGIYDNARRQVVSFNWNAHTIWNMPGITENGDIVILVPTEEGFATKKIGSICDLEVPASVNPYR